MWVVKFDDVSKVHRGAATGPSSLRRDLARVAARFRGATPPPRLRSGLPPALDHVSFEIEQGDAVALVGTNGAGKTTALRIMSRIISPTGGRVHVRGRIGALLEVGSGVHPELSGRENVWLYGSIIGIPRAEIRRRFDDIVDFAELGHAIDRQAKFYSSGMQLRLGFAIATFLEPQTLLVDESLATADLNFQLKCVDHLTSLVRNGTSLVFVSHELAAVETLCRRALLLERGSLVFDGDTRSTLTEYQRRLEQARQPGGSGASESSLQIVHAACVDDRGDALVSVPTGGTLAVELTIDGAEASREPVVELAITDGRSGELFASSTVDEGVVVPSGDGLVLLTCRLDGLPFQPRSYRVWAGVRDRRVAGSETAWREVASFRVDNGDGTNGVAGGGLHNGFSVGGPVHVAHRWSVERC